MSQLGSTLAGVGGGAATGAAIGSGIPIIGTGLGAIAGGLWGGITGFLGSKGTEDAAAAQHAAIDQAMKRLQAYSQESYARRQDDLKKTLAFYNTPDNYLRSLYGGTPASIPNIAPPPPGTAPGTWAGGPNIGPATRGKTVAG